MTQIGNFPSRTTLVLHRGGKKSTICVSVQPAELGSYVCDAVLDGNEILRSAIGDSMISSINELFLIYSDDSSLPHRQVVLDFLADMVKELIPELQVPHQKIHHTERFWITSGEGSEPVPLTFRFSSIRPQAHNGGWASEIFVDPLFDSPISISERNPILVRLLQYKLANEVLVNVSRLGWRISSLTPEFNIYDLNVEAREIDGKITETISRSKELLQFMSCGSTEWLRMRFQQKPQDGLSCPE